MCSWKENKDLTCVILCAGKGTRMESGRDFPKVMMPVKEKPILYYVIDFWKRFTNNFVFVVGYKKSFVIDFVKSLDINSKIVEQKELRGIAHAISLTRDHIMGDFIVVLGDCFFDGDFKIPDKMEQGFGVCETEDLESIKNSYSVEISGDLVSKVVEKPKIVKNNLCGMGFYFFNEKVFEYIKKTGPSKLRDEIEITDVIDTMIKSGEKITPVFFNGFYLNATFKEDVEKIEKFISKTGK